jgi:hypothetical protein
MVYRRGIFPRQSKRESSTFPGASPQAGDPTGCEISGVWAYTPYLPVFYLNQWARPDGKVIRYHRPVGDVVTHPIAPKNTGYERGLYRLDGYAEAQRNAIETDFMSAVVEGRAAERDRKAT